mmetsp:Transcript_27751/g.38235  ORF Transcript_27751/g.38235 Transcript_27751/m.38235 type:complete len:155 (-) Transcript_27751:113-577(-)
MDSIRELTNTINVFVRFFESINCLFWQIDWLRRNVSSSGMNHMTVVLIILAVCVYLTFFASNQSGVSTTFLTGINVNSFVVGFLIIGLIIWLVLARFQNNADSQQPDEKDREASVPFFPIQDYRAVAPAEQYNVGLNNYPATKGNHSNRFKSQV